MSIMPMHQSGALVLEEALICASPVTKIRLSSGAPQAGSPAGDWQDVMPLRTFQIVQVACPLQAVAGVITL
jgi:hypothetical protein